MTHRFLKLSVLVKSTLFRHNVLPFISACSVRIGSYLGVKFEQWAWVLNSASVPVDIKKVPLRTPLNSNISQIMRFGYPSAGLLKVHGNFALMYDRRNKIPNWVFEHLSPHKLSARDSNVKRSKSKFVQDKDIHKDFRSNLADYKNSDFVRGHLAAAGNHNHNQNALNETFIMSNISPQVGKGFNNGIWNVLERYVHSIARKNKNTYVCTGPLYLPRREYDGKMYVKYQVLGKNQVAVPTHFFKIILIETNEGLFDLLSYVLPNKSASTKTQLAKYFTPVDAIEKASGFLFFDKLPKEKLRYINGKIRQDGKDKTRCKALRRERKVSCNKNICLL